MIPPYIIPINIVILYLDLYISSIVTHKIIADRLRSAIFDKRIQLLQHYMPLSL